MANTLVIGCGRTQTIGHTHPTKGEGFYTLDSDAKMEPDYHFDITDRSTAGSITLRFKHIFAEAVPGDLFGKSRVANTCYNIATLMAEKGNFYLNCGAHIEDYVNENNYVLIESKEEVVENAKKELKIYKISYYREAAVYLDHPGASTYHHFRRL